VATPPQNPRRRTRPQLTAGSGNPNCSLLVLTLAAGMREACFPCGCLGHLVAVRLCLFRRTAPPIYSGAKDTRKEGPLFGGPSCSFLHLPHRTKGYSKKRLFGKSGLGDPRLTLVRSAPGKAPGMVPAERLPGEDLPLSFPHRTRILAALCKELNLTRTSFPGSML
jgi:hypothetical protein